MGLNITKKDLSQNDTTVTTAEQPISCDVLLPDYYPDISRILSCKVTGQTTSVQSRGDKLNIDGLATIEVLYQNEEQGIHGTQYKLPFSKVIQLKTEHPSIEVEIKSATPICKALSRRRIDVSTTLTLIARITAHEEVSVLCHVEGNGVESKTGEYHNLRRISPNNKTISLSEKIPLPQETSSPITVVTTRGLAKITEIKPAGTRVIVKGELQLWILLWNQEEKKAVVLNPSLPWTSLLENSEDEGMMIEGWVKLLNAESIYGGEYNPDDNDLTINAQLETTLQGYLPETFEGIEDVYSRSYGTKEGYQQLTLKNSSGVVEENFSVSERFHLPEGVSDILMMEFHPEFITHRLSDEKLHLSMRGTLSVIAKMSDGGFECFERQWDMEHSLPLKDDVGELEFSPRLNGEKLSWQINEDMLTVNGEMRLTGTPMWCAEHRILTSLEILEDQPKDLAVNSGLMIYYAQAGESLWDIAKRYNSSIYHIQSLNSIEYEILTKSTPIIIPRA